MSLRLCESFLLEKLFVLICNTHTLKSWTYNSKILTSKIIYEKIWLLYWGYVFIFKTIRYDFQWISFNEASAESGAKAIANFFWITNHFLTGGFFPLSFYHWHRAKCNKCICKMSLLQAERKIEWTSSFIMRTVTFVYCTASFPTSDVAHPPVKFKHHTESSARVFSDFNSSVALYSVLR